MKRISPWWNQFPFIRLLVPLIAGIYFQQYISPVIAGITAALTSGGAIFLRILPIYLQYRLRFITGVSLHALVFAFGALIAFKHDIRNSPEWFGGHHYEQLLAATLTDPRIGKNGYYVDASVLKRKQGDRWYYTVGKIRLRISGTENLVYRGSLLHIRKHPKPVENNPGATFDYRQYLANQNIYHQLSLKPAELELLHVEPVPRGSIVQLRTSILSILDRSFPVRSERALAKALLVGERAELEESLINAYTNTGVIHVIAISGLHLGLIYGMLIMILKPFSRKQWGKHLVNAVIAAALWTFTLVCGASASVVRSAVMFSSLLLGDTIGSENNTGNALASSAFLLLCYDPFLVRDIGFQLSYAAVASLLIYNQSIASVYHPENKLLAYTWSSISTSVSAQILTTPIVLVHFHQFPLVFILSNLVAVPVSGIILLLLILLCMFQAIPGFAEILTALSSYLIWFMNQQVLRISSLPFSSWKNIAWTSPDLIFSYLTILFFTISARTRSPKALVFFLLTILTWLVCGKYSLL